MENSNGTTEEGTSSISAEVSYCPHQSPTHPSSTNRTLEKIECLKKSQSCKTIICDLFFFSNILFVDVEWWCQVT